MQITATRPEPVLTRQAALDDARAALLRLAKRAFAAHPDRSAYIVDVWTAWDDRLEELKRFTGATIGADTQRVFEHLVETIGSDQLEPDALLEWIDAFPDAIADLFPPSAATFQCISPQRTKRATVTVKVATRQQATRRVA